MSDSERFVDPSRQRQGSRLKVTRSESVTERPQLLFGLEGFGIFLVFAFFVLVVLLTDNFPISLGAGAIMFFFLKFFLSNKPPKYLLYIVISPFFPKRLTHRCSTRSPLFPDEEQF